MILVHTFVCRTAIRDHSSYSVHRVFRVSRMQSVLLGGQGHVGTNRSLPRSTTVQWALVHVWQTGAKWRRIFKATQGDSRWSALCKLWYSCAFATKYSTRSPVVSQRSRIMKLRSRQYKGGGGAYPVRSDGSQDLQRHMTDDSGGFPYAHPLC